MSLNQVSTLRPGYLVGFKTSVRGNVSYRTMDLEFLRLDGGQKKRWETERRIKDEKEQEAASVVRSKARSLIQSVCSTTEFGYLCPMNRKADLDEAFAEARKLCREFNATSAYTTVKFSLMCGYVADNDVEAVKAINNEVRGLLDEMIAGVENGDVLKIRNSASKATQIGQMLTKEAEARIQEAVDAARATAKKIVKAGTQAAVEIDRQTIQQLNLSRVAFLDVDGEDREVQMPEAADLQSIDLEPATEQETNRAATVFAAELDI